ncbi:MAG: transcription antitermination factor NusB [Acidobacteria bacterium]|nr:transcription antitermination factor NusB [Acidobacteriota bacterium]
MPARHQSRRRALQILYQWDMRQPLLSLDEATRAYYASLYSDDYEERPSWDEFTDKLTRGALEHREELDALLDRHSQNWRVARMSFVDRNILRLAAFEMIHTDTPAPVVIDEAIELARRFSSDESVAFVNGVLDALRRQLQRS